jgi:hypothetical protein
MTGVKNHPFVSNQPKQQNRQEIKEYFVFLMAKIKYGINGQISFELKRDAKPKFLYELIYVETLNHQMV